MPFLFIIQDFILKVHHRNTPQTLILPLNYRVDWQETQLLAKSFFSLTVAQRRLRLLRFCPGMGQWISQTFLMYKLIYRYLSFKGLLHKKKHLYIRRQSNTAVVFIPCTPLSFNWAQVLADIAALELALVLPIGVPVGTVQLPSLPIHLQPVLPQRTRSN